MLGLILVMLAASLGAAYWYLSPENHFREIPVLSGGKGGSGNGASSGQSGGKSGQPGDPSDGSQGASGASGGGDAQTPPPPADTPRSFNVLILGVDSRNKDLSGRTDVIMVAHVNPQDKSVHLVSIPRDTRVPLQGIGETKINHAHYMGNLEGGNDKATEASVRAVSDFLQAPIHYYVKMNFSGFEHFVDTIGGVDVTFPAPVGELAAGTHHLNGEQTLIAVRERYSLPNGDIGRQVNQSLVLKSILFKMLRPENLSQLPTLLADVQTEVIDTNFRNSDLISLALLYQGMSESQFHYQQIPGDSGRALDPLVGMELEYWIADQEAVREIRGRFQIDTAH